MKRFDYQLGAILAALAFALLPLMGCGGGVECGEGTFEQDGECVLQDNLECPEGQIRRDGQCIDPQTLCASGTVYDDATQACVPESELTCGEGTVDEDGQCVPGGDACGANTTLDEQGRCVAADPVSCGANTELDPNENRCFVTEEVCAANTAFDGTSSTCIPTEDICQEGTVFDDATRLCMPAVDCKPGDVVVDGFCLSPAEALVEDADVVATFNSNPNLGGQPISLPVKDIGETTIFTGTILPPSDVNNDGELDQHIDFYLFQAEAGDWFEITLQSLGMATTHFMIQSMATDLQGNPIYFRHASVVTNVDKARQIVIPQTGQYILFVLPESSILQDGLLVGGNDWDYVGTLEKIETPEAVTHDFEDDDLMGTIGRLDENYFFVENFEAEELISFIWELFPDAASPIVQIWSSPTDHVANYPADDFQVEIDASGEFYLLVDWAFYFGALDLDYQISATEQEVFAVGEEIDVTVDSLNLQILEITQDNLNDAPVLVTLTDETETVLMEETLEVDGILRYVWLNQGEYTVTFTNDTTAAIGDLVYDIELVDPNPFPGADGSVTGTSNELNAAPQDFFHIQLAETTTVELTLTHTGGGGWGRLFIYGEDNELLHRFDDYVGGAFTDLSVEFELEADTSYIYRVGNDDDMWDFEFDYELTSEDITDTGDPTDPGDPADPGDP